ncbi:hypothetical protein AB0A70_24615 [Streptomyces morookaense]|uniref:hypothetical protein n=1 Tax=Streptomyces morookaense TaxID=1970 RepID=UPI0033FFAECA
MPKPTRSQRPTPAGAVRSGPARTAEPALPQDGAAWLRPADDGAAFAASLIGRTDQELDQLAAQFADRQENERLRAVLHSRARQAAARAADPVAEIDGFHRRAADLRAELADVEEAEQWLARKRAKRRPPVVRWLYDWIYSAGDLAGLRAQAGALRPRLARAEAELEGVDSPEGRKAISALHIAQRCSPDRDTSWIATVRQDQLGRTEQFLADRLAELAGTGHPTDALERARSDVQDAGRALALYSRIARQGTDGLLHDRQTMEEMLGRLRRTRNALEKACAKRRWGGLPSWLGGGGGKQDALRSSLDKTRENITTVEGRLAELDHCARIVADERYAPLMARGAHVHSLLALTGRSTARTNAP